MVMCVDVKCRHFMAEYIERLPVETERKAHKLLQVCEKNGLHSQCNYHML